MEAIYFLKRDIELGRAVHFLMLAWETYYLFYNQYYHEFQIVRS